MGKIEIDHTGANAGITLSSDGTDLLLDGTAIGGGGGTALELYAENPVTPTAPSATGDNAVTIGSNARASTPNSIAIGTDANTLSGTIGHNVAIGYNATASGHSSAAIGYNATVSSDAALAIGYGAVAAGDYAASLGRAHAAGTDSFAAAIANNTSSYGATGNNSIAMGGLSKATQTRSFAVGYANQATAFAAGVIGVESEATAFNAMAYGSSAKSAVKGKHAFGTRQTAGVGKIQAGLHILWAATSNATPASLATDGASAASDNQAILPNDSAFAFHGTIVARENASFGTDCAAWKVEGLIRREGSAGTTVLVNSATTILDNTPAWGMALTADTTNGGLAITVTGAASTNIRWVATINTSEVTY